VLMESWHREPSPPPRQDGPNGHNVMRSRLLPGLAHDEAVVRASLIGALMGFVSSTVGRSALGADLEPAGDFWVLGAVWGGAGLGAIVGTVTALGRAVRLRTVEA
jgi:hypothetical protein